MPGHRGPGQAASPGYAASLQSGGAALGLRGACDCLSWCYQTATLRPCPKTAYGWLRMHTRVRNTHERLCTHPLTHEHPSHTHTYTCTHTFIRTYPHTHAHTHIHAHTHAHVHTRTPVHTNSHTRTLPRPDSGTKAGPQHTASRTRCLQDTLGRVQGRRPQRPPHPARAGHCDSGKPLVALDVDAMSPLPPQDRQHPSVCLWPQSWGVPGSHAESASTPTSPAAGAGWEVWAALAPRPRAREDAPVPQGTLCNDPRPPPLPLAIKRIRLT